VDHNGQIVVKEIIAKQIIGKEIIGWETTEPVCSRRPASRPG